MRQIIDEYAAAIGAVEDAAQRAWAGAVRVRQDPEARPAEKLAALRVMGLADRHRKSFKALRERTLRLSVSSVPSVHSLLPCHARAASSSRPSGDSHRPAETASDRG